jgi:peptide deformylase
MLITIYDDKDDVLHTKCEEVIFPLTREDRDWLIHLKTIIDQTPRALAVAAPQVGWSKTVFMTREAVYINPKITWASDILDSGPEECLSIPDQIFIIERPKSIMMEYYTTRGEWKCVITGGLNARCFLHEIDHLNGQLINEGNNNG